jgi:hypothetical protein
MRPRSRSLLALAVAIAWLVLGPMAMLYGSCAVMCEGWDMTCPAAPGVEHAPQVDPVVACGETAPPIGELQLTVSLAPPAPPPKPLRSA